LTGYARACMLSAKVGPALRPEGRAKMTKTTDIILAPAASPKPVGCGFMGRMVSFSA